MCNITLFSLEGRPSLFVYDDSIAIDGHHETDPHRRRRLVCYSSLEELSTTIVMLQYLSIMTRTYFGFSLT